MIPRQITLEGFMSYRDKETLDFDGHALWVLSGPNGAGKSAVFDAMTFALYGQYRGGEQQHATRLINNHGANALKVTFVFQVGTRIYKVQRTQPRKGSPTWEAFEFLADEWARIEGEDSVRKSEDWVKRTIGLSYEAFVSSVMLLQGHSERLLKAKPMKRYEILSELIEMAPYQELEERVERARAFHEAETKRLDRELQGLQSVSETALQEAASTASAREAEYQESDRKQARWVQIHKGAMNHEHLTRERDKRAAELDHDKALITRAEQIRAGLARFQQLDAVLGTLQQIAKLQQQLQEGATELAKLEAEVSTGTLREQKLEAERAKKEEEASGLLAQLSMAKSELEKLQERLTALAPVVAGLQLIQAQEKKLDELSARRAQFPSDLSEQREKAREKAGLLEEARAVLDVLDTLSARRSELLEAEEEGQKAQQQADVAIGAADKIAAEEAQLTAQREQTLERQRVLDKELSGAQASWADLEVRLKEFTEAAEQRQCSLCGQPIDEQHAEKERERLLTHRTGLQDRIDNAKKQLDAESVAAKSCTKQLKLLQERKAQVEKELGEVQAILKGLPKRLEKVRKKLVTDFQRLTPVHQKRIWSEAEPSAIVWRETSYPSESDLRALKKQAEGRTAHGLRMRELDAQHDQYVTVNSQILQAQETLDSLSAVVSKKVRLQARAEQEALLAERQRKQQAGQLLENRHGEAAAAVRAHQAELQASKQKQKVQESLRVEKRTQLTGWEEQRLQGVAQLPESWREKGAQLTTQDLTQAQTEHTSLKDFVAAAAKLDLAEKRQSDIRARLDELKLQIDAIPPEERVLVAEVVKELTAAADKRKNADELWRKAQQDLSELQRLQSMRTKLDKQHREESRQSHLHKRLARLLGREELQRSLMRATEREIVRLANVILSDLSRTRMQLRLRHEDSATTGGKAQEKQKALDLEFLNADTGPQWMDIELASGSQCFRIAISLALAMGSYFGRDACRVESVIIDEGFGCLDKVNREDTIEVLNALQSTMKRIILVSHQDEFSHEFKNGYEVRLEDKRSRVSRMVI